MHFTAFSKWLLFALAAWSCMSCATADPSARGVDALHLGMEKDTVVQAVGNPTKTRRAQGKDHWIYEFRDHTDTVVVREVDFENGFTVYIGAPLVPKITAEEQDRLNDLHNKADDDASEAEDNRRNEMLGATHPSKDGKQAHEDALDRRMREQMYGVEPDIEREKRKVVPTFTPIN